MSKDALRRLGDVDREQIEQRIRTIYEHWSVGDVDGLTGYLAPDVTFPTQGYWTGHSAPLYGRERVSKSLRDTLARLENIVSVLHEIVIDGDRAVVHRTAVGRRRDDGRRYQCDFIAFFRFRDGLVVEFSQYPDAAWRAFEAAA